MNFAEYIVRQYNLSIYIQTLHVVISRPRPWCDSVDNVYG